MMVETVLESPQDLGMTSSSGLPQWKRELIQRRAARTFTPLRITSAPVTPTTVTSNPPPAPPFPSEEDEELRYGPGIVKRLKSRYLSLALREAPRRRPSVLRRATSLEHLLEQPPLPPPQAPPPRQAPSHRAAAAASRRDSIKRARSVDALSRLERLDSREEDTPPAPAPRAPRPPRRPPPLLSDAERPPPDVVRSALRKFESAPPRRSAPSARVSGVLRGLARTPPRSAITAGTQTTPSLRGRPPAPPRASSPRCSTPEPRTRTPSPAASELSAIRATPRDEPDDASPTKVVSRAALEGIARAGASVRYSFECAPPGTHLPALAAANPVMLGRARLSPSPRQVGVIRPMPSPTLVERSPPPPPPIPERLLSDNALSKPHNEPVSNGEQLNFSDVTNDSRAASSSPLQIIIIDKCDEKIPSVIVETVGVDKTEPDLLRECRVEESRQASVADIKSEIILNGNADMSEIKPEKPKLKEPLPCQIVEETKVEKVWKNGVSAKNKSASDVRNGEIVPIVRKAPPRRPPGPPAANTIVFNFSNRKEVPDYIENDGLILRASRKDKLKPGDPGVVLLQPPSPGDSFADSDEEAENWLAGGDAGPPSPCDVRFVNDNILINGRSSLAPAHLNNKDRLAKLKLQFDDSLTRTHEYPSESSLSEDAPLSPSSAAAAANHLGANTHLVSAALASYQPSKIRLAPAAFQLGVTRTSAATTAPAPALDVEVTSNGVCESAAAADEVVECWGSEEQYLKPCADTEGRAWSDAQQPDLLF